MKQKSRLLSLLLPFMLAAGQQNGGTMGGASHTNSSYKENSSPEAKGLHLYKCNGHKFFAHNDREAVKRAKLKGYWSKDAVVTLA